MLTTEQLISFASSSLILEGMLHLPDGVTRRPGVVICHPHPRYGGDMDNNVVASLAHSLRDAGMAALRFNFRGVGGSQGTYDRGVGEAQDACAALDFLTIHERIDASRIGIAGYSFGAGVALRACAERQVAQAVVSIACPTQPFTELGVREIVQPKLLIGAELDHDLPAQQFKFLARRFAEPKEVRLIVGADHFFSGHGAELGEVVSQFFVQHLGVGGSHRSQH